MKGKPQVKSKSFNFINYQLINLLFYIKKKKQKLMIKQNKKKNNKKH